MRKVTLLLLCIFSAISVFGQDVKRPDTYNYNRAMEAMRNDNYQEAIDYLNKEVNENTKNGYAYLWIAVLRHHGEEYGRALTAINLGIKNLPKKDSEYIAFAYRTRSDVYEALNEIDKSVEDISTAIKHDPDNEDFYEKRAQLYYEQEKYDLSDKDYRKIIELNEGGVMGYMGIGRNANQEERYEDAIRQFDYVLKLHPDYSSGYSFRAESYLELKKYNEAIDDVISALDIDGDDKAFRQMQVLADSAFIPLVTKFKIQQTKKSTNDYWPYCLGVIYERKSEYAKAVDSYKQAMKMDPSSHSAYRIASCLDELGLYSQALEYCLQAIELNQDNDTQQMKYIMLKANIQDNAGLTKEAIDDIDFYISEYPEYFFGYYRRGWFKDHSGDLQGAIEDYSTSITLEPDYAYAYLNRGIVNRVLGNEDKAQKDFQQVILLDTIPNEESIAQYAFLYLGEKEKAIEWQDKVLLERRDEGAFYDATCLYSIMGEKEKALSYLHQALDKGFRRFAHIARDRDLNNIRETPDFKKLIEEFTKKHEEQQADVDAGHNYVDKVTEIPFISEGGVYKVKCTINDLPLHFIFDTGASDVSMSTVEATFMLKNNYLSSKDIVGKQNYMTATGEISEGTVINLRNVSFGGLDLTNIKASIVESQNAPLLLGQSVLNKLGTIEIDNQKKVLKVIYKEKQ